MFWAHLVLIFMLINRHIKAGSGSFRVLRQGSAFLLLMIGQRSYVLVPAWATTWKGFFTGRMFSSSASSAWSVDYTRLEMMILPVGLLFHGVWFIQRNRRWLFPQSEGRKRREPCHQVLLSRKGKQKDKREVTSCWYVTAEPKNDSYLLLLRFFHPPTPSSWKSLQSVNTTLWCATCRYIRRTPISGPSLLLMCWNCTVNKTSPR